VLYVFLVLTQCLHAVKGNCAELRTNVISFDLHKAVGRQTGYEQNKYLSQQLVGFNYLDVSYSELISLSERQ